MCIKYVIEKYGEQYNWNKRKAHQHRMICMETIIQAIFQQ